MFSNPLQLLWQLLWSTWRLRERARLYNRFDTAEHDFKREGGSKVGIGKAEEGIDKTLNLEYANAPTCCNLVIPD